MSVHEFPAKPLTKEEVREGLERLNRERVTLDMLREARRCLSRFINGTVPIDNASILGRDLLHIIAEHERLGGGR